MNDKIYPSMVIRSQAEAIELLEQENQQLKDRINKAVEYIEDKLKIYPEGLTTRHLGQEFLKDILDLLKGDKE